MLIERLNFAQRYLSRPLAEAIRTFQALRERQKTIQNIRKARGITLLREWLSAEQQAQFDVSKCFDVIGCDSGKRYRIHHGTGTNIHEIGAAGRPVRGWCFVPTGELVAGDVMLAQKIALETHERAALAVANSFIVHVSARTNADRVPWRAY
jgi:hypothetical protein